MMIVICTAPFPDQLDARAVQNIKDSIRKKQTKNRLIENVAILEIVLVA